MCPGHKCKTVSELWNELRLSQSLKAGAKQPWNNWMTSRSSKTSERFLLDLEAAQKYHCAMAWWFARPRAKNGDGEASRGRNQIRKRPFSKDLLTTESFDAAGQTKHSWFRRPLSKWYFMHFVEDFQIKSFEMSKIPLQSLYFDCFWHIFLVSNPM